MRFFADYLRADFAAANLKGGSGGGNNTTVTNQTAVNPLAQQAYQTAINTGTNVAQTPYPTYNSPLVAGFNPTQQAAFSNINNAAGVAQPYIGQAANLIQASTSGINPAATVGQYMSPYTNDVVQGLQNVQNQQNAAQQTQLVGQAVGAGAFGGDRAQIAQSMLAGQQALGENPAISQALQSGYSQALNTGLSSQEANAWLASQGAFGLANLGQEAQGTALSGANAQLQAGGLEQQLAQEQLSVPYGQFQAAQAYPYQITNMELGLATGAGGAGGTATTTSPGPSALSQLTGLGLTGIGLANTGAFDGLGNLFGSNGASQASTSAISGAGGDTGWLDTTGFIPPTARGGRIPHRALGGALHYDDGGALPLSLGPSASGISPVTQSGLGSGNPMYGGALNQLSALPTEKLQELQARIPPGSPQGGIVQAVLRRRQMMPQSDPSAALQAPAAASPMQGLGGLPGLPGMGMASGGDVGNSADVDPILLDPYLSPATAGAPPSAALELPAHEPGQRNEPVPPLPPVPDSALNMHAPSIGSPPVNPNVPPVGLSAPGDSVAPWTPQPAALGNVGLPQGAYDITGQAENSGRVHGGGPMTSSGEARGLYQITDGTWHDFAPKAGIDLSKYPNADSADKDTQTKVASIIPIQRWDPRTVTKLQAAYPNMDPTKPLGSLGAPQGTFQSPSMIAMNDSNAPSPQHEPEVQRALGPPQHGADWTSGPGAAMLAAGLGILGGTSPFASVNIGKGGLEGLNFAENQRLRQQQADYNYLKQQELDQYRQGTLADRGNRTAAYGQVADARTNSLNAAAALATAKAAAGGSKETFKPYAENGGIVTLMGSQGHTMNVPLDPGTSGFTQERITNTATQGADKLDLARQALALRQQAEGRALTDAETNETLKMYGLSRDPISGKAAITPEQAQTKVQGLRGNATPEGGPQAPLPKPPPAPKVGDVVQGYKFLGGDPAQQGSWAPAGP